MKGNSPHVSSPNMPALLNIPRIKSATAFHLERWQEILADPVLRKLPERIETNRYGQIVMMPPPGFSHSTKQSAIFSQLLTLLPPGAAVEVAVLTSDGVKGADVVWISESRIKRGLKGDVLTIAPEICVEVVSPGNTRQEMEDKRALYFEAGAEEVWLCDVKGTLHFFLKGTPTTAAKASALCPAMTRKV